MYKKILFVHSGNETFTKIDFEILEKYFHIEDFFVPHKFPKYFFYYWVKIKHSEAIFCWFGSWNSFWALLIAKLMRKPSVLIVGGYDVANVPEADYGNQRGGVMKWVTRGAMLLATRMFTNSNYSKEEIRRNIGNIADEIEVIYHGVPDPFKQISAFAKKKMVLTVGGVDKANLLRKGLIHFTRAASELPDYEFVLVGGWIDNAINDLKNLATPNIKFAGRVSDEELNKLYEHASVYVQASAHEGFGMSVAEAMLAGCVPVVSRSGSLPEVVGDLGFIVESTEPSVLARAIRLADASSMEQRLLIRDRIINLFPISLRREKIVNLLSKIA